MPRPKNLITVTAVRELFAYDESTGELSWRCPVRTRPGDLRAGCSSGGSGYVRIKIKRKRYLGHRLAWLHFYGEWPPGDLDHINGIRTDNRIANLRAATPSQNAANAKMCSNNKIGLKGVSWQKRSRKYRAQIRKDGTVHILGLFDDPHEAHAAYAAAAKEYHGEFARAA